MPRTRWQLNPREQVEHRARAEQLRDLGIDLEVPKMLPPVPDVDFEIGYAPDFHNVIFNYSPSRIMLVTGVRIVGRHSVYLDENIRVSLPWDGPEFELWYTNGYKHLYRIVPGLTLELGKLINQQLEEGIRLQRGKVLSGLLLAVAYEAQLPKEFSHGTPIRLRVGLIDSLGDELAAEGTVHVDRRLEITQQPRRSSKGNLFEAGLISAGAESVENRSRRAYLRSIAGYPDRAEPIQPKEIENHIILGTSQDADQMQRN
jgi:hypothetical protein